MSGDQHQQRNNMSRKNVSVTRQFDNKEQGLIIYMHIMLVRTHVHMHLCAYVRTYLHNTYT